MNRQYIETLRRGLPERGIQLARGLTEREICAIEEDFGFAFPPDLRILLGELVPRGDDFPDWHAPHSQDLIEWLDMPADGVEFDVEENGFWLEEWGPRPEDPDDAVEDARRHVAAAPMLVPVYSNRFLPAQPCAEGNPILAVMQTEVSVGAPELGWFFHDEFGAPEPPWKRPAVRTVEFWSGLGAK
jgi:hypothetical protein